MEIHTIDNVGESKNAMSRSAGHLAIQSL
jgi:hypothetical protein